MDYNFIAWDLWYTSVTCQTGRPLNTVFRGKGDGLAKHKGLK